MRQFGLIGFPLTHSFSKKYFTEKFEKEDLSDCQYELFPLNSIDEFPQLLKKYPDLKGLNITVPYKKKILPYLDSIENIPKGLPACNCIYFDKGLIKGYNTDWIAFEKSLMPHLQKHHTNALVLGQGGAAEAVIFVLKKEDINFSIVSRTSHDNANYTYKEIDKDIIQKHSIIINTTPLGMYPDTNNSPEIPYQFLTDKHLLYDLIYNPAKTLFLKLGEEKGATIKNGEEMLILQAEESWKIWNS